MSDERAARLREIEQPRYEIPDVGTSVWLDHRDRVLGTEDYEWLITELKAAWERENIYREALDDAIGASHQWEYPTSRSENERLKMCLEHIREEAREALKKAESISSTHE